MKKASSLLLIATLLVSLFVGCEKEIKNEAKKGCMDPSSINYNPEATEDDGSCSYLASTSSSQKTIVIEDFTGVKCTFCPFGHRNTEQYISSNPNNKVVVIATQTSNTTYGTPYSNQQDLRSGLSAAFEQNAKLGGYPGGTINRTVFESGKGYPIQINNGMCMTMSATSWFGAADEIFAETAPVNVGVKSTFNSLTRELKVVVETYYTSTVTEALYMHVAITEDSLVARQLDNGVTNSNYVHNHVLRTYLTGQWGEMITTSTEEGTRTQATYTYTLPESYDSNTSDSYPASTCTPANCHVVAFVSEYKKNILNAGTVALTN